MGIWLLIWGLAWGAEAGGTAQRACPQVEASAQAELGSITARPGLVCYREHHANAEVFFSVESTVRRDSWGTFPRMVRQLIVVFRQGAATYEVQFVTDPRADGKGLMLFEREGQEVLVVRKTVSGQTERSRFSWVHRDSGFVMGEVENPWPLNERRVRRVMRRLRRVSASAHHELEPWIVSSTQLRQPPSVELMDADERAWLVREVFALDPGR